MLKCAQLGKEGQLCVASVIAESHLCQKGEHLVLIKPALQLLMTTWGLRVGCMAQVLRRNWSSVPLHYSPSLISLLCSAALLVHEEELASVK